MTDKRHAACRFRRWGVGVVLAGAAVVGASISGAPSALADTATTPDEVVGQANQDLPRAVLLLTQVPQGSLDPDQLGALTNQESLTYNGEVLVTQIESMQADLPAADQAGLADVNEGILQTDQQLLDATQTFIAADGFDSSGTTALTAQLDWSSAAFETLGADFHAPGADLAAELFSSFGVPDFLLP